MGGMANRGSRLGVTVTRHSLVRVDDAKVNLTLKSSRPMWFQLVGVQLPNANGSTIFPDGDNVQTVERWYPPGDSPGLDYPILKGILDEIDAGPGGGVRYSSHHNAKGRHVSNAVLKVMPDQSEDDAK